MEAPSTFHQIAHRPANIKKACQTISLTCFKSTEKWRECLPASFDNAGNQALRSHLSEAKAGELKLAEESSRSACKLATVVESDHRRVFWHSVQGVYGSHALFNGFLHVEDGFLQLLALVPFVVYESFSFFLLRDGRFFCHFRSFLISCAQALFGAACGWDLSY